MVEPELPRTALVDTGVFMRFLGERPEDPHSPACVEFCRAMFDHGNELFVAAPTIAEIMRHRGSPIPRVKGVTVVPFDERAAHILGLEMPMVRLHQVQQSSGHSLSYLKYDAMISACALRCRTRTLIALDSDHVVMARHLGLSVLAPSHFTGAQIPLFKE
jgi:predicted nucleic acid-binding protein